MNYQILDICRHVIQYNNENDYDISNLKLQKILYFIQAYFLIEKGSPCFDEKIEAWDFGPVVPEAYKAYEQFGNGNIYLSQKDAFENVFIEALSTAFS